MITIYKVSVHKCSDKYLATGLKLQNFFIELFSILIVKYLPGHPIRSNRSKISCETNDFVFRQATIVLSACILYTRIFCIVHVQEDRQPSFTLRHGVSLVRWL